MSTTGMNMVTITAMTTATITGTENRPTPKHDLHLFN
jgi:hypothetical protein